MNILITAQGNKEEIFLVQNLSNDKSLFSCGLNKGKVRSSKKIVSNILNETILGFQRFSDVRKIRLAVAASGEYSRYYIEKAKAENFSEARQKEIVLIGIQESVNNVNQIFRRDLGVELVLVDEMKKLIFLDPKTDGLRAGSPLVFISELTERINSLIGKESYDIGHGFMTAYGGLSAVGSAFGNQKAYGVTGAPIPEGKLFDIDFFAHELGHQLGATHTQNSDCSRNLVSSVELGSGNTIMGYAGVCSQGNTNLSSLPYFHDFSIAQIKHFLRQHFEEEGIENLSYGLKEVLDYKIPKGTPFEVELKASYPMTSKISYTCGQIDNQVGVFPPSSVQKEGPAFSVNKLSESPHFYYPNLEDVLNNNQHSKRGVLSNVPRIYNFLASARIEEAKRSITSLQKFKVEVVDLEPFRITTQSNENVIWDPGSIETISWVVGGTKSILGQDYVKILLSDNNGKSFDYVLSEKTPNNGQAKIRVPSNISSSNCRIKIKALSSVFYCVNNKRFSVTPYSKIEYEHNSEENIAPNSISEIEVEDFISYEDLEVSLKLIHDDISELQISLANPDGKKILLWNQSCRTGLQLDVLFKDEEKNDLEHTQSNKNITTICDDVVVGFKIPSEALKGLRGKTKGMWKLKVSNLHSEEKIGVLKHWGLRFIVKGGQNKFSPEDSRKINFFPNPVKEVLHIEQIIPGNSLDKVDVFSVSGELKKTIQLSHTASIQEIQVGELPSGVYFFRAYKDNSLVLNKKIIIQ